MSKKAGVILGIISIVLYIISLWMSNFGGYISYISGTILLRFMPLLALIFSVTGIVISIKSKTVLGIVLNALGILIPSIVGIAFLGQAS